MGREQCQEANRFYESEVNRLTSELKQQEKFRQELVSDRWMQVDAGMGTLLAMHKRICFSFNNTMLKPSM